MIENRKKIVFTDSAQKRLLKLHENVDVQIENYLTDRKYVPGDDFVEITGSDIDDVEKRLKIIRPVRSNSKSLILNLYGVIGILTFLIGIFYEDLKKIVEQDNERLIFLVIGLSFSLASFFLSYFFKRKAQQENEILKYEKRRLESFDDLKNLDKYSKL